MNSVAGFAGFLVSTQAWAQLTAWEPQYSHSTLSLPNSYFTKFRDSPRRNAEVLCRTELFRNQPSDRRIWAVAGSLAERGSAITTVDCHAWSYLNADESEHSILRFLERLFDFRAYTTPKGETYWFTFERRIERPNFVIRGYRATRQAGLDPYDRFYNRDRTEIVVDLEQRLPDLQAAFLDSILEGNPQIRLKLRSPSLGSPARTGHTLIIRFTGGQPQVSLRASDGEFALTPRETQIAFPPSFKFGVTTAAHQVEGYTQNSDWYAFENQPGKIFGGTTSLDGPNHWDHSLEDAQRIVDLGVNTYRMSIAWDKLEPKESPIDRCDLEPAAVTHYREFFSTLLSHGVEPLVTLHHFVFPKWVRQKGGWDVRDTSVRFAHFARCAYQSFGDLISNWVTINEPFLHILGGYATNRVPPAKNKGVLNLAGVMKWPLINLLIGHRDAYRALHEEAKKRDRVVRVGLAHRHDLMVRAGEGLAATVADFAEENINWVIPRALQTSRVTLSFGTMGGFSTVIPNLAGTQDFYGMHFYARVAVGADGKYGARAEVQAVDEMDWESYPQGFYTKLKAIHALTPDKPIWVLENGTADGLDLRRERHIRQHLQALAEAQREGVPVERYYYWSLLDNFEWDQGLSTRFGLYAVDYRTLERTLRPSGAWFSRVVRSGMLPLTSN